MSDEKISFTLYIDRVRDTDQFIGKTIESDRFVDQTVSLSRFVETRKEYTIER